MAKFEMYRRNAAPHREQLPMRGIPANRLEDYDEATDGSRKRYYCALAESPSRAFAPGVTNERQELINMLGNKWVSGTVLRYYFFDQQTDGQNVLLSNGTTVWRSWVGDEAQKAVVRCGFQTWKDVAIGIDFKEVTDRTEAEIRIGFMRRDGAWSFLGRKILDYGPNERTMNFGWDLTRPGELDTAIHEIGHTLGFPHEHQNPKSGIE